MHAADAMSLALATLFALRLGRPWKKLFPIMEMRGLSGKHELLHLYMPSQIERALKTNRLSRKTPALRFAAMQHARSELKDDR